MKRIAVAASRRWGLWAVLASLLMPAQALAQPIHTLYALVQGTNQLIRFDSTSPNAIETIPVTGVVQLETLRAVDFRPATGELYAIANDSVANTLRLYTIDPATGVATGFAPEHGAGLADEFGMSFNPVADRLRIVSSSGRNMRLNPNNGVLSGLDTDLSSPVAPPPIVDAVAYDRQFANTTQTTLFAINRATNSLAYQGGFNGGVPPGPNGGVITDIGALGVTIGGSSTALEVTSNGTLFAAMRPNGGLEGLYTINPATGAATLVGTIGDGTLQLDGLAVVDPTLSLSPATGTYISTQRFDFVMVANLLGRGVVSGTATVDGGVDVTSALAGCIVPGFVASGPATLRCPNVALGGPLLTPGKHSIDITLVLNDGSQIHGVAMWTILAVTEP